MEAYVNLLARLLDSVPDLDPLRRPSESQKLDPSFHHHSYQVLKAFLWTAWQRSLLVFSYYIFGTCLRCEMNAEWYKNLPFPDPNLKPELDFSALGSSLQTDSYVDLGCEYMCRYSFELLRISAVSATQDYRTLLARFKDQFCDRTPRCRQRSGVWEQCDGKSWSNCGRFFGLEIDDQSAHDMAFTGLCKRKQWDERSYRSVQGPRAVSCSLSQPDGPLKYCLASDQTLAVSHVWSHGQGGNPEQGFNECLHNCYSAIAKDLGCDSYWIDAACIPSDPELRSAAINTINPIFRSSKVTLICDKDIMTVDATELSIRQLEILVSTLRLSDWNVRGWTLLEVIRGSKAVHLLCKNNRPVSLKSTLLALYRSGSIDLCSLLMGSHHLMPPSSKLQAPSIEAAGVMLSRRYASRRGDEVIIWSLLCGNEKAHRRPESLWESKVGSWVKSGYLMPSCDRVTNVPGFSWAPATPQARGPYTSAAPDASVYWSYDGVGTASARITRSEDRSIPLRGNFGNCTSAYYLGLAAG